MEGMTEWYAQQISNNESLSENESHINTKAVVGYEREVGGVSIIMIGLIESGLNPETIDKAFLGNEEDAVAEIKRSLKVKYGEEEAEKILNWNFKSPRESLEYITELEAKQTTGIGGFLRTF